MKNIKSGFSKFILLFLLCVSILLVAGNYIIGKVGEGKQIQNGLAAGYHIQIITEKGNDNFWKGFCKGAQRSADENGILLEFVDLDTRTTDEIVSLVKRGVYSGVDGIAFCPTDIALCSEAADLARENGTTVLIFESEENILPMTAGVNSDYHQVGTEQGSLLMEATGGVGNVAVIMDEKDMQEGEVLCNVEKMRGIVECFPDDGKLQIVDYYKVDIEMFQTEKVIRRVFEEHPEVDSLICTDAVITQTASEYIKNEGLEGRICLIGYGSLPETLEDIKNGIIYGSVYPDEEEMGYQVVQKLYDILENDGREDILNLKVKVIKGDS